MTLSLRNLTRFFTCQKHRIRGSCLDLVCNWFHEEHFLAVDSLDLSYRPTVDTHGNIPDWFWWAHIYSCVRTIKNNLLLPFESQGEVMKRAWASEQMNFAWIFFLPFILCVTLIKSFNFSKPQSPLTLYRKVKPFTS